MKRASLWLLPILVVLIGLYIGNWLGRHTPFAEAQQAERAPSVQTRSTPTYASPPPTKLTKRPDFSMRFDSDAADQGALRGQRWISFADSDARDRFIDAMRGKGIALLGRIDALNTLRVGFLDSDALADLLDGSEESGYIYPADIPGGAEIPDSAIGFGTSMMSWIGAPENRDGWGSGITVAVLDTGIIDHSAFSNRLLTENFVELPDDRSTQSGHGTAVASLIASALGLAPDANLLSYRVADDTGSSDTFTLAQSVIAATDAGAQIINISMGSNGNSTIFSQAISYAQDAGVIIVASAGNDALDTVSYPAAYPGVVAVGAIDATGTHLDFSNSGNISLSAPGLEIASAWTEDQTVLFSGTSASAPVVTGAIAALMTQNSITAQAALDLLLANANESGAPGIDPDYGNGVIDLGRALNSSEPGIIDIALASNYVAAGENNTEILQVTVENRGTTAIVNAPVTVDTPTGIVELNVSMLPAGEIQTFELPFNLSNVPADQEIRVDSKVGLSDGSADSNPSNNSRVDVYAPDEAP